ncbi:shikimate dehydrogenase [Ilumatobacter nonamiensis]|uniref:shikimate dehydrogenase n=1 Tax=Ilumatobacter nonamiensis TaxID=467093 RepID=UPI0003485CBF|nr:shikimate dehydrogenase [Ilumatobacter nonamiensis]
MTGRLAAVIGSPIAHSLSPAIHRAAFDAAGIDWSYVAFDVADGEASSALSAMRTLGIAGLSVTMPHKAAVAELVDRLDPAARALQSVNTVSWDGDDLVGSSTDGAGFVASLADAGVSVAGARVAIIGAGGAARSLVVALAQAGSDDITVLNRSPDKAEQAAALVPVASPGVISDLDRADIVVNATSVGMGDDDGSPCEPERLHDGQVVADLVYHPLETRWLRAAAERGCRTVDGLGMLVHQAALQQRIWLGDDAVIDTVAMRTAAESALATRN